MAEGVFGRSDAEIDLLVRGMRSGIAVVGFGYIGTVIGAVLADRGWPVTGIDVRQSVVDEINLGKTTVPEPGLNELVSNNVRVGRLRATTDFGALADNDFRFRRARRQRLCRRDRRYAAGSGLRAHRR